MQLVTMDLSIQPEARIIDYFTVIILIASFKHLTYIHFLGYTKY